MIEIKPGVDLHVLSPQIVLAITIINSRLAGRELVITSVCDGTHSKQSKHYTGNAIDLRSYTFSEEEIKHITKDINLALGEDYDFIYESGPSAHFHLEYDPKLGPNK